MKTEQGMALIVVTMVVSFMSAIGVGLALIVFMDRLASGNLRESAALFYASDAALELAVRELSTIEDWNAVLTGVAQSAIVDGPPSGVRAITRSEQIDLTAIGNELTCGRPSCTAAQIMSSTRDRPWGANNARWRLFAYGPLGNFVQLTRPLVGYLAVWVGDDGREDDGDPGEDGAEGAAGHDVIRVHVGAYGPQGIRRAIEAELARLCVDGEEPCAVGIRVQSWKEVRQSFP